MIELALFAQLLLGGTPHSATVRSPAVLVVDTNADGSTFTRPVFGYNVFRAEVVNGIAGSFTLLNPDVLLIGMLDGDGNAADVVYEDDLYVSGAAYVYKFSAVDFGGESALSTSSNLVTFPVNPNVPTGLGAVIE